MRKALIIFNFFIGISLCQGQIQKGAYQIDGEASILKFKEEKNQSGFYSQITAANFDPWSDVSNPIVFWKARAIPSFQYFLNNRLSLGAALGFEKVLGSNYSKLNYTRNLLFFSPEATYFLNPKAKWKLYINGSYLLAYSQNKYKDKSNYNSISHGFDFNIGVNRFLNDNVAFNSSIFVDYNDVITDRKKDYIYGYSGINLGFQNFISQKLHQQYEENLLHRKRTTIGGRLIANLGYKNVDFSFDYGYFPSKNLLIGLNTYADLHYGALSRYKQQSVIKPYLQYYIPFTKKTAIFSNISIPISLNYYVNKKIGFISSLGFNHFLSKYVAIEFYGKYKPYQIANSLIEEHKFSVETNIRYFLK